MHTQRLALASLCVLTLTRPAMAQPAPAAPPAKPGVVFVVDGIGGLDLLCASAEFVFPRKGLPHQIRPFPWSHGPGKHFLDLLDTPHLVRKANELAEQVKGVLHNDPQTPVYLIGRSGGSALVLLAAEQLPPQSLERIILLSAGVSPGYDLRPALRAVRREIVSFHSKNDQFVLNWCTRTFGTLDRVRSPGAGMTGFVPPNGLGETDRALYERLVQIPWRPAMLRTGNTGSHLGTAFPLFLAVEVAPWLK